MFIWTTVCLSPYNIIMMAREYHFLREGGEEAVEERHFLAGSMPRAKPNERLNLTTQRP